MTLTERLGAQRQQCFKRAVADQPLVLGIGILDFQVDEYAGGWAPGSRDGLVRRVENGQFPGIPLQADVPVGLKDDLEAKKSR